MRGEGPGRTRTGEPYLDMLGAVLSEGANGNPDYFRMPCGIDWCEKTGLDPEYLFAQAIKYTPRRGEKFTRLDGCFYLDRHRMKKQLGRCAR